MSLEDHEHVYEMHLEQEVRLCGHIVEIMRGVCVVCGAEIHDVRADREGCRCGLDGEPS